MFFIAMIFVFCGSVPAQPLPQRNVEDEAHKALVRLIREKKLALVKKVEVTKPALISLHFQDANIRDVLRTLSIMGGLNIVYGDDVKGRITIHLEDVTFEEALRIILKLKGLVYKVMSKNTLRAMSLEAAAKEAELPFTQTVVFHFNYAQAADIQKILEVLQRED